MFRSLKHRNFLSYPSSHTTLRLRDEHGMEAGEVERRTEHQRMLVIFESDRLEGGVQSDRKGIPDVKTLCPLFL